MANAIIINILFTIGISVLISRVAVNISCQTTPLGVQIYYDNRTGIYS